MTIGSHDHLRANTRAITCAANVNNIAARVAINTLSKVIISLRSSRLSFWLIGRRTISVCSMVKPAIGQ